MAYLNEITDSLLKFDIANIEALTKAALEANIPPDKILFESLIPGMQVIGKQFGDGEIFLPELLMSGEAIKASINLLKPLLAKQDKISSYTGKAAIGTVEGDIHDIGKNIVVMMLEANWWDVTDLGIDITPEEFCIAVQENDFQILGLSSLLTTTMPNLDRTIEALKAAGLRDKVKVAIGGAPVSQSYADQIGADCYAGDAAEAVAKFQSLIR